LVSMSIFTMVSTAAVGVLLVMIDSNRKSQNIQSAMNNLSFALDSMTRDIRTGSNYFCGTGSWSNSANTQDCSTGDYRFAFNEGGGSISSVCSPANPRIRFYLGGDGRIYRDICGADAPAAAPITSEEVDISELDFVVTGTSRSDHSAPLVSIYIEGTVNGVRGTGADFNLQTTVTQQLLDI